MKTSRADLHMHTTRSDGLHAPRIVAHALVTGALAVAAVTDHDTISGALEVEQELAGDGPEIVIGSEVTSAEGHILALFVDRDVPPGLPAATTIAAIHDAGGLAIAAHPFSIRLGVGDLGSRLDFDAVEVVNGSPLMGIANARARRCLGGTTAAALGGSDAHVAGAIGGVHTIFAGETAAELRFAILAGLTRPAVDRPRRLAALPAHVTWLAGCLAAGRHRPLKRSGPTGTPS